MVFKEIKKVELYDIIAKKGFDYDLMVKDYYLTILLYLMKDIKGLHFKGGTVLQLTLLDHARISEDIDFTLNLPLEVVKKDIKEVITTSGLFGTLSQDKDVDGFVRLIVPYKSILGDDRIFIDLNERGKLLLKPELLLMNHFYPNMPLFKVSCLNREEMVAEKVAAAIGRNKPRDHYDIYQLIKHDVTFNMDLVRQKCAQSGVDPSILKMFNKAKTLRNRWNSDMLPLLVEEVSFQEVMKTLAAYFKLKEEKDKEKEIN